MRADLAVLAVFHGPAAAARTHQGGCGRGGPGPRGRAGGQIRSGPRPSRPSRPPSPGCHRGLSPPFASQVAPRGGRRPLGGGGRAPTRAAAAAAAAGRPRHHLLPHRRLHLSAAGCDSRSSEAPAAAGSASHPRAPAGVSGPDSPHSTAAAPAPAPAASASSAGGDHPAPPPTVGRCQRSPRAGGRGQPPAPLPQAPPLHGE